MNGADIILIALIAAALALAVRRVWKARKTGGCGCGCDGCGSAPVCHPEGTKN